MARLEAERRLREAEESLSRLERAVNPVSDDDGDERDSEVVQQEMISDVKTLKSACLCACRAAVVVVLEMIVRFCIRVYLCTPTHAKSKLSVTDCVDTYKCLQT